MKYTSHLIAMLTLSAAILSSTSSLDAQVAAPDVTGIVWKQTDRNIGTVSDDVKVILSYEFTNQSPTPVKFVEATSSCKCAKVTLPSGEVAPGASSEVIVEVNTKDKMDFLSQSVLVKVNNDPTAMKLEWYGTVVTEAQLSRSLPIPSSPAIDPTPTEPVIDLPVTSVEFDQELFDFREIQAGSKVKHRFTFTNTGSEPLKVYNVKPSCGCTTPDWSKEPVQPGASGYIEVEFDSAGKSGVQKKSVTVTMNTEPRTKVLNFQGEVVEEPVKRKD